MKKEQNPLRAQLTRANCPDPTLRGWGVAGVDGGLFWVQDFSMEGKPIQEVRSADLTHTNAQVEIQGLNGGTYSVQPYDTWQGETLEAFEVTCLANEPCLFSLPPFQTDMAFKLVRGDG